MKSLLLILITLCVAFGVTSCSGGSLSERERADSARRADSLAESEALRIEQSRADSIRLDSIRQLKDALAKFNKPAGRYIFIHKPGARLYLMEGDSTILSFGVCLGKGIGQKTRRGDHKTPEGEFKIRSIEDATYFPYDFKDGRGTVYGTYGPWFMRLTTPQSPHIGIHGTIAPESIGKRESDGCIRLRNEDLENLKQQVFVGMTVLVSPDIISEKENTKIL